MVTELPAEPNTKNLPDYTPSSPSHVSDSSHSPDAPAQLFLQSGEPFEVIGHVILSSRASQIIKSHLRRTFTLESTEHEKEAGEKASAPGLGSTNGHEQLVSSATKDKGERSGIFSSRIAEYL